MNTGVFRLSLAEHEDRRSKIHDRASHFSHDAACNHRTTKPGPVITVFVSASSPSSEIPCQTYEPRLSHTHGRKSRKSSRRGEWVAVFDPRPVRRHRLTMMHRKPTRGPHRRVP